MPERIAKRLLIVGWDAADWKIIDTLFAPGGMPNLRRLVDGGVRANLASLEPRLSPILWTSITTGKTGDKHGILNFVEPDPVGEGLRIASSTSRQTKALWNILTQNGMRVNVVNWYASHPAEPIRGVNISNLFQEGMPQSPESQWPLPPGSVHPAELADQMAELRLHVSDFSPGNIVPLIPTLKPEDVNDSRVQMLLRNMAHCISVHNAATSILADAQGEWDCTMVFYETIDTIGHNFMPFHPPRMPHVSEADFEKFCEVMAGVYQFHDMMLGALLQAAGPETTVLLLSDHGFYSDHQRPVIKIEELNREQRAAMETAWHRPLGVLAMSGPGLQKGKQIYGATLLDIAPTALTLLGVPVGSDMPGRVLAESFDRSVKVESVFSWDMIQGDAGLHPPDLRQDPFAAKDAIKQLIDLGYMADWPADAKAQHDLAWRESQCNLGTVYTSSGYPEKAVPVFEELSSKYPDESRFTLAWGHSLFLAAKYGQACDVLKKYLAKNPHDADARLALAHALAAAQRSDESRALLTDLEGVMRERPETNLRFGAVYSRLEDWDAAARHFRAAFEHNSSNAVAAQGLAKAMLGLGRLDEAVDYCLRATALVHVYPDAHQTLGMALAKMKDYPHAIKSFEVAISMRPGDLDSHRYLASIYRETGKADLAAKHREIAERILAEQGQAMKSVEFIKKGAPIQPQKFKN